MKKVICDFCGVDINWSYSLATQDMYGNTRTIEFVESVHEKGVGIRGMDCCIMCQIRMMREAYEAIQKRTP